MADFLKPDNIAPNAAITIGKNRQCGAWLHLRPVKLPLC